MSEIEVSKTSVKSTPTNEAAELLTTAQVSEVTWIAVSSLERCRSLRNRGFSRGMAFFKLGQSVRCERKSIEDYLAKREARP